MAKKQDEQYFIPLSQQNVRTETMEDVMHSSMLPYAEHVILERALPRVEDGLKPVQRRVLYAMYTLGLFPDKPTKKSAHIVGECMAKYHPHGDSSIYETMVRMAQDFNLREPLVYGQGNFGSIDGDSAAAFRYTEARLAPIALEMLRDIDKDTVKWSLNFDDSLKEPDVLPGRFPNLLVNGSYGIAVGLATNIPTHNLGEVIDSVVAQIDNPRISLSELLKHVKGPDFPTGGYIINGGEIENVYRTGKGKLTVRAKTAVENASNGKKLIVISEIPYGVNKAKMLADILKLAEEKKGVLSALNDIRDESDMKTGMRAVIELKKDADVEKILALLFKYSDLQNTFGVNMVAIADGKPMQLGLFEMNRYYIEHYKTVERRRVRHDLEKARLDEEIQAGLLIAIQNIDRVVKIIRTSANVKEAKERLRAEFTLTDRQATAILEMRLARLTALEAKQIEQKLAELRALIAELEALLADKQKLMQLIKKELLDLKRKYKSPRRTVILSEAPQSAEVSQQDFKVVEDAVLAIDKAGSVRRVSVKNFKASNKEVASPENFVVSLLTVRTDERVLAFSNKGYCYAFSVDDIAECKWRDKGTSKAKAFSGIGEQEVILFALPFKDDMQGRLLFCTKNGMIKCSELGEYAVKKQRFQAISLKDNDEVLNVELENAETQTVLFVTEKGMSLNMTKQELSSTGRVTSGVKGIALDDGDRCVFARQVDEEGELIVWSDKGYAKRSLLVEYEAALRNRKGLKTFDFKKNGANGSVLIGALWVKEPYEMLLAHASGQIESVNTEDIMIESRLSAGKPYILVVMGDVLTEAVQALQ